MFVYLIPFSSYYQILNLLNFFIFSVSLIVSLLTLHLTFVPSDPSDLGDDQWPPLFNLSPSNIFFLRFVGWNAPGLGHGITCLRDRGGSEDDSTHGVRTVSTGKATGKNIREEMLTVASHDVESLEYSSAYHFYLWNSIQVCDKHFTSRRKPLNKFLENFILRIKYLYSSFALAVTYISRSW